MTLNLLDWDEDLQTDPAEEYQALLNGLRRSQGFGLYFVQCSPFSGGKLIERLQTDLTDKKIAILKFEKPITDGNVFKRVSTFLAEQNSVDVLVIQGLENSLFDAEETKKRLGWSDEKANAYTWREVPPVLINLNQQRERFRDSFPICFVFLLPQYAIKYLIHRAPDFFDWRSGLVNYASDADTLARESERILQDTDYSAYQSWSEKERNVRLFTIQTLIDEPKINLKTCINLYFEQGLIFYAILDFSAAKNCFDKAVNLKPNLHILHAALYGKGLALAHLGQYDAAIAAYDQALAIKPDYHEAIHNKGIALDRLGQYDAAITAYDQALAIKPDNYEALYNKGIALDRLGQYEAAIATYDHALKINPNNCDFLNRKGLALTNLGRYEEAIACHDAALAIQIDNYDALYIKGLTLIRVEQYEAAVANIDAALSIYPDNYHGFYAKGIALRVLGQYETAITAYGQALAIKPDYHEVLYDKACCYGLQGDIENAIDCLQKAIGLAPTYRDDAKTDTNFDPIRHDERFRALVEGESLG